MARIGEKVIWVGCQNQGANSYKYGIDIYEDSTNNVSNNGYYRIVFSIMPVKSRYSGWTDSDATFRITTNNGQSINADSLVRGSTSAYPNYKQWYTIATWKGTLNHKDDGSLDISVSINFGWNNGAYAPNNATISLTSPATVIPRASDISCNSPIVMGTNQTVTVTQKSTSFSHILYYKTSLGEYVEIGRNSGVLNNNYSWAVPDITASLPSATSDNYTLRVLTYLNETYEGDALESLLTVVATVPASYVPTIEITNVVEGNSAVPSTFPYIVGYSKPKITTRFTGSAGSTCVSRSVNIGNETQTSTSTEQDVQFQMIQSLSATTNIIRANTTDSRGRTGSATQIISAYAYVRPNIQLDCTRCDVDGSVNALGDYIKVRAKWNYDSVNNKNSATIKTYQDGTLKNTYTPTATSNSDWVQIVILSASSTQQFTIKLEMSDLLDTSSVSQVVSKAVLPFSLYDDGTKIGASFGRMATSKGWNFYDDNLEVDNGNIYATKSNGHGVVMARSNAGNVYLLTEPTNAGRRGLYGVASDNTTGGWLIYAGQNADVVIPKSLTLGGSSFTITNPTAFRKALGDNYSTNEVNTGRTWINGKPIYRRAYTGRITSGTSGNIHAGIISDLNIDTVISIQATCEDNDGRRLPMYYHQTTDFFRCYINANGLIWYVGSSYPVKPFTYYCVIEYTKTTD